MAKGDKDWRVGGLPMSATPGERYVAHLLQTMPIWRTADVRDRLNNVWTRGTPAANLRRTRRILRKLESYKAVKCTQAGAHLLWNWRP